MPQAFDLSAATRIAVQRAGRVAKLAYLRNSDAIREWEVGESLDLTEDAIAYNAECETIINKMVALNGDVPAKDRGKMNAFQSALLKECREVHGENFDLIGGYFLHDGNALWVATRREDKNVKVEA